MSESLAQRLTGVFLPPAARSARVVDRRVRALAARPLLANLSWRPTGLGARMLGAAGIERCRRRLRQAGIYDRVSLQRTVDFQAHLPWVATLIAALSTLTLPLPQALGVTAAAGVAGWLMPAAVLRLRAWRRRRAIARDMPLVLEMLLTLRQSGLGLEAGLAILEERGLWRRRPAFTELEMLRVELHLGRPRHDAFDDLGSRAGSREFERLAVAMLEADRQGIALRDVLQVQADVALQDRKLRLDRHQRELSVKITLPLVLCILPGIFVVTLGPVLPSLVDALGLFSQ